MTTFKIDTVTIGQHPRKLSNGKFQLTKFLLYILTSPFKLLTAFNKSYTQIDGNWEQLYSDNNLKIEKRLVAATGFDDSISFYILSSTDNHLNKIIGDKIFGDFICKTNDGILLRQFRSPKDWPNSKLIYINFYNYNQETVSKTNSSWVDWSYKFVGDKQIDIVTEHQESYKKILRLFKV